MSNRKRPISIGARALGDVNGRRRPPSGLRRTIIKIVEVVEIVRPVVEGETAGVEADMRRTLHQELPDGVGAILVGEEPRQLTRYLEQLGAAVQRIPHCHQLLHLTHIEAAGEGVLPLLDLSEVHAGKNQADDRLSVTVERRGFNGL